MRPEEAGDDRFADREAIVIELRFAYSARFIRSDGVGHFTYLRLAAGVNQHRRAARENDQRRISLPYVKEVNRQSAGRRGGRRSNDGDDRSEQQNQKDRQGGAKPRSRGLKLLHPRLIRE